MSSIKLSPNASGTGEFTIAAPNSNTNRTLTLPDQTGTVLTNAGPFTANASASAGAVTIDASNNVGVGTSSPSSALYVKRTAGSAGIYADYNGTNIGRLEASSNGNLYIGLTTGSGSISLGNTANANAVFLDSSGNLLVGTTSTPSSSNPGVRISTPGNNFWTSYNSGTTAYDQFIFGNANGIVGRIQTSASSTSFLTSSDYRLKHDIQPMTGALAKVAALKPVTYKWNADGKEGQGFIAHELQEVVPDCVSGEKDAVDADGNPQYQGIDTSFLVATLTAAIQELNAKVAALEARLASDGPSNGGQA